MDQALNEPGSAMCIQPSYFSHLVILLMIVVVAVLVVVGRRIIRRAREQASDPTLFNIPMIWLITGLRRLADKRNIRLARDERDRDLLARAQMKLTWLSFLLSAIGVAVMVAAARGC